MTETEVDKDGVLTLPELLKDDRLRRLLRDLLGDGSEFETCVRLFLQAQRQADQTHEAEAVAQAIFQSACEEHELGVAALKKAVRARGHCKACGAELDEYCDECEKSALSMAIHEMTLERQHKAVGQVVVSESAVAEGVKEAAEAEWKRVLVMVRELRNPFPVHFKPERLGFEAYREGILEKLEEMVKP